MALYRKYRPTTFDDVIGQEAVVTTLKNGLDQDSIAHALTLTGPHGTGKTTLARLVAKGLNCSQGPTASPCGECDSCQAIDTGSSPDVFELDAASHRGVDDARLLRERLQMSPVGGGRLVFIIDEAHMLTREAQNALLKSLEEPPPGVHFIFCTTAPHKLLDTIRSRCHRFGLQRANAEQLAIALNRVAHAEDLSVSAEGIVLIASAATGSFRDALSFLDQVSTVHTSNKEITVQAIEHLLGRPADLRLAELVSLLAAGDGGALLTALHLLAEEGYELEACTEALAGYLRLVLYAGQLGSVPAYLSASAEVIAEAESVSVRLSVSTVLLLLKGLDLARQQSGKGVPLEMGLEVAFLTAIAEAAATAAPSSKRATTTTPADQATPKAHPPASPTSPTPPAIIMSLPKILSTTQAARAFPLLKLVLRHHHPDTYLALRTARARAQDGVLTILAAQPLDNTHQEIVNQLLARFQVTPATFTQGAAVASEPNLADAVVASAGNTSEPLSGDLDADLAELGMLSLEDE